MKPTEKVRVELGPRSYDIVVGDRLIENAGELIAAHLARPFVFIVTDEHVAKHHLDPLKKSLNAAGISSSEIVLPPGESTKNFTVLETLLSALLDAKVERSDTIIALGGGVVGDITGFAASILRRGISFVQIPTSLLAQVDSSVGGKTGINMPHGKNLVGSFHQPRMVLADVSVLDTLPERELKAGYAEIVKYGLINDAAFFSWLEEHGPAVLAGDAQAQIEAVVRSCQNKAAIVGRDEHEAGERALLNLGHTFGHALEAETGYSERLIHGEGVALGMVLAFELSRALGYQTNNDVARVRDHLTACAMPTRLTDIAGDPLEPDRLIDHIAQDKKVKDGRPTFVLATAIGEAFLCNTVDMNAVARVLEAEVTAN